VSVIKTIILSIASIAAVNLSGLGLNVAFGQDVTLVVDGQATQVSVIHGSVAEVLTSQNVTLESRDRVNPELNTIVKDDMVITVDHSRLIDLTLDGQNGDYWTFASTVGGVLTSLGLSDTTLKISAPSDTPVPREGMSLTVSTGHPVTVAADGQTSQLLAFGTVVDALTDLGLTWDDNDLITPAPTASLSDDLAISLVRVDQQTVSVDVPIPFDTQNSDDPDAAKGKVTVVTPGQNGVMSQTVLQTLHDGVVVNESVTGENVTAAPVTQITVTGTKAPPAPAVTVTPGSAQAIAYDMVIAQGWDDSQFNCLVSLWNRESGWRVNAANSSGAYGIPQALPGSKMASAGADWQTNPATQIAWGLDYISGRYGTPCGAWSSFQSKGWY